ncbi:porin family protein [Lewinella sp. IMCC34183]|uniref:porin family protein n=1 Tax=Lewinella sp. IMCC34183 TaxID=2248762 RepID=UPI000E26F0C8|nr:porin family protein [Lewinella sp. IMCC34183]
MFATARLFLLVLLPCFLSAQADTLVLGDTTDYRRLQLGVTGGPSFHEVDFTPGVTKVTYEGYNYGVALRYFDKQLVGFQAEVTYNHTGWREDFGDAGIYERQTDYAEVLILTQFSVGRGAVQPMLQAGPYIAVPLSEQETLPPGYDPELQPFNTYYGRPLPFRINYGLLAGLGLNVELGPLTVQLDGRYRQGFSNLIRPGESQAATSIRRGYGGHVSLFYAL